MRDEGEKPDIPMSLICGFVSAMRFTYATSLLIHSIFSYAEAAGCHVSMVIDNENIVHSREPVRTIQL
jgi:hypothetical protein